MFVETFEILFQSRDQRDWVFTLETDTETFSSLVSSSRLRQRLKFWNLEIESLTRLFFWLFRGRDWTFHIFETETETETWMSLKIETFRDRDQDFSIMTFNTVPREKFQLAAASWNLSLGSSVRVCLFTFGDDEHAIELEEYVSAQG